MGRVIEYQHELSNARLEQLENNLFQVTLSGFPDIAKASSVTDWDKAHGLQVASNVIQAAAPSAIRTSFATSVAPQTYSGADLNGAMIAPGTGIFTGGVVSITASLAPGAYSTAPIVITRTDVTPNQTATLAFPHADGGITITSRHFAGLLQIAFPAMASGAGVMQIGVAEQRVTQAAAYPIIVRQPTMEAAIHNAFSILKRYAGESLVKSLGRSLGPGELVSSGMKLGWAESLANMRWFGL